MRIVTWNLAKRVDRAEAAGEALAAMRPDLVLLQSVTRPMVDQLRPIVRDAGLHWIVGTIDEARRAGKHAANVVAARWRCDRAPMGWAGSGLAKRPWVSRYNRLGRERPPWNGLAPRPWLLLRAVLHSPWGLVDLIDAHTPSVGRNPWDKVKAIEAVTATLNASEPALRVLGGDFGTPRKETAEATRGYGRGNAQRGDLWEEAELGLIGTPPQHGLVDAYRAVNPVCDAPHAASCRIDRTTLRRFDHLFVSRQFTVQSAEYRVDLMDGADEPGLSDHAPLVASFDVRLVPVGQGSSVAPPAPSSPG